MAAGWNAEATVPAFRPEDCASPPTSRCAGAALVPPAAAPPPPCRFEIRHNVARCRWQALFVHACCRVLLGSEDLISCAHCGTPPLLPSKTLSSGHKDKDALYAACVCIAHLHFAGGLLRSATAGKGRLRCALHKARIVVCGCLRCQVM